MICKILIFVGLTIAQAAACAQCAKAKSAYPGLAALPACSRLPPSPCAGLAPPLLGGAPSLAYPRLPLPSSKTLAPSGVGGPLYEIILENFGPNPNLNLPINAAPVTAPAIIKPLQVLPADVPAPKIIGASASCVKTYLKPQLFHQLVSVPILAKFIQTATKPIVEVITFNAKPILSPSSADFAAAPYVLSAAKPCAKCAATPALYSAPVPCRSCSAPAPVPCPSCPPPAPVPCLSCSAPAPVPCPSCPPPAPVPCLSCSAPAPVPCPSCPPPAPALCPSCPPAVPSLACSAPAPVSCPSATLPAYAPYPYNSAPAAVSCPSCSAPVPNQYGYAPASYECAACA